MSRYSFLETPAGKEFLQELKDSLAGTQRPAHEVLLDEVDLCNLLKISKRHAADLRKEGQLKYSKSGGKIYYKLSWVLEFIERNKVEPPKNRFNLKTISHGD